MSIDMFEERKKGISSRKSNIPQYRWKYSMLMCYFQFKFNLFTDIEYNSLHSFASSSNFSHLSYFQFEHWTWYVDGIIVFVFHLNSRNWETNQMRDGNKKIRLYLWCQHCICVWCVFTVVAILLYSCWCDCCSYCYHYHCCFSFPYEQILHNKW